MTVHYVWCHSGIFFVLFVLDIPCNLFEKPHGLYRQEQCQFAMTLHMYSPKAYEFLRKTVPLPAPRTLCRYICMNIFLIANSFWILIRCMSSLNISITWCLGLEILFGFGNFVWVLKFCNVQESGLGVTRTLKI